MMVSMSTESSIQVKASGHFCARNNDVISKLRPYIADRAAQSHQFRECTNFESIL